MCVRVRRAVLWRRGCGEEVTEQEKGGWEF